MLQRYIIFLNIEQRYRFFLFNRRHHVSKRGIYVSPLTEKWHEKHDYPFWEHHFPLLWNNHATFADT